MTREKVMRGEGLMERKHVKVGLEEGIWRETGTHPGSSDEAISCDLFFIWTLLVGGMKMPLRRLGIFPFTDWNWGRGQEAFTVPT